MCSVLPSVLSAFVGLWEAPSWNPAKSRAAVCLIGLAQTPLGLWSPGDLFVTPAWGMLGVRALSCESGWAQTGSLGVKKRLGGWRNHSAGRDSLSVCVYMFEICTCPIRCPPPQPTTSVSRGNNPGLCEHLQARPALPSLLPCSFYPPRNTNRQRRCFTGCGCFVQAVSSSAARSLSPRRITLWTIFD